MIRPTDLDLELCLADLDRDAALTTDMEGRMVFVGLTYEESVDYLTVREVKGRKTFTGTNEEWLVAVKKRARLGKKHETIRRAVIEATCHTKH